MNEQIYINNDKELYLMTLYAFFASETDIINPNMELILPILKGESIALRTIEWFVTNYCKQYNIIHNVNGKKLNIYNDYKCQLMGTKKKYFDPCCRNDNKHISKHIPFKYTKNNYIRTTIGQLNFFKWFIENDLLTYITANHKTIYLDQCNRSHSNTNSDISTTSLSINSEKKRHQLSENSLKKTYINVSSGTLDI